MDFHIIQDCVPPTTPSRASNGLALTRATSSGGFSMRGDRSCTEINVKLDTTPVDVGSEIEGLARQTWSGFPNRMEFARDMQDCTSRACSTGFKGGRARTASFQDNSLRACSRGYKGDRAWTASFPDTYRIQRKSSTADVQSSASYFPRARQRRHSRSAAQFVFGCGSPFWNSLLQVLPLQDGGHLAAASRACSAEMRKDLLAAGARPRQCIECGQSFTYSSNADDCRYHPGKETIVMVVDGLTAGMMDVSWTCCGRGNAYSIGIAVPCTRNEILGCQQRKHRPKIGVALESVCGQLSIV